LLNVSSVQVRRAAVPVRDHGAPTIGCAVMAMFLGIAAAVVGPTQRAVEQQRELVASG